MKIKKNSGVAKNICGMMNVKKFTAFLNKALDGRDGVMVYHSNGDKIYFSTAEEYDKYLQENQ